MIVKRVVKFNIKKNHVDYNYIKQQSIESKEIYNYANYIIRQLFFKKSKNNQIIDADLNGALNIMKKNNIEMLTSLDYLKFNNIFTSKLI